MAAPKAIIQDIIEVINPRIKALVDVAPAKNPKLFINICKELNIVPIISKHSIQTLSFDKLLAMDSITKQIKMDINHGKVGIYCNPPFKLSKLFMDSILTIFNEVKLPIYFMVLKKMLGYDSCGINQLLDPEHKKYQASIRVYEPSEKYQYYMVDGNDNLYQPNKMRASTVIVTLNSNIQDDGNEHIRIEEEEIRTDQGNKILKIYKIDSIRHYLSENELNEDDIEKLLECETKTNAINDEIEKGKYFCEDWSEAEIERLLLDTKKNSQVNLNQKHVSK